MGTQATTTLFNNIPDKSSARDTEQPAATETEQLLQLADSTGVDHQLALQLQASGRRAVYGNTWVHSIATLQAPWSGSTTSLLQALQWVSTAHGSHRGWNIRFEDGSSLSYTRRYDPSARAVFERSVDRPISQPPMQVRIGNGSLQN